MLSPHRAIDEAPMRQDQGEPILDSSPNRPREAPKWQPDAENGGIETPLVPAAPPPYGAPPPAAPPPYRSPTKKKSNTGLIITLVVTVIVLIAAVGAWGMMRGFKQLQSDFGDSAAQTLVRDGIELEDRYYKSNKKFADASSLASETGSTPRPRKFVESDPKAPDEVKVVTNGDNMVCLTARSAGGTYWAAGVIASDGAKSTYYLVDQFRDPLDVCGSDSITVGRKGGFPTSTKR